MACGALATRSDTPMPSSKISRRRLETSIPTQRRVMITVPVPVMRGLLVQPRATVQVDRWNGRETEPAHGVKRQGPNGFPPTPIMTDLPDTGTQGRHDRWRYAILALGPGSRFARPGHETGAYASSREQPNED